jgi:signal transduction histidine kinase
VSDLPKDVQISSQARHNICMAVKEAVHNIIKHSNGSEATIRVEFVAGVLNILVADNGCGFEVSQQPAGHGLINMKARLHNIGGTCVIESRSGKETVIRLQLVVNQSVPAPQH